MGALNGYRVGMMVFCWQRLQLEYAKDNYRIELPRTEVELLATKVR